MRVNSVGVKSKSYNLECFVTVFVGVNEWNAIPADGIRLYVRPVDHILNNLNRKAEPL